MSLNSLDTVKERVEEFGFECLHLPKKYEVRRPHHFAWHMCTASSGDHRIELNG
jgi:hypothetical protein